MQVLFECRVPEGMSERDIAVNRVQFVLRRLSARVGYAKVLLNDINGPRGGLDKHCQIELRAENSVPVVVTATASNWRVALNKALNRAHRLLLRTWQRGRTQRNRPLPLTF